MTYPEALKYLDSFINYEKKDGYSYKESFKLDRIKRLTEDLGDPQLDVRSIHVAGTKGKGSVSAITHSILKSQGLTTGLYTSPHLENFRERIRLNDSLISENDVAHLIEKIKPVIEGRTGPKPSFFEVYTALAYLYFSEEDADLAVYETGLGGRLDATNVLKPLVSAITPISYEHIDKLGHTLGEIAFEKAGIIKRGSVCVTAHQEKEVFDVISSVCSQRGAKLMVVGKDISFEEVLCNDKGSVFNVSGIFGRYPMLECGLLGSHQIANAALSIGIIESLRFSGITISPEAIRSGIKTAVWPGRLEVVSRRPLVVLDGAQNRASAKALADAVKKIFKYNKLKLVLGVSKDKDIEGLLEELMPISDSVVVTKSKIVERAADPEGIKAMIGRSKKIVMTSCVDEAMDTALSQAGTHDLVLVTGSLFVVGEARTRYANIK
ncbi:MAG: bifunctional folylpolyglutamate synthase/dihydrofolate synthase [Candidatus Omnitrophica bacterium]|nr:bifunctional folylpolyglutamate synthase/dihydrofolate synthase [Candidatus Omnitrophota bacterium]